MIIFFKLFFILLFFSSSVYSANSKITPLTELDCDTKVIDDGSAIKKCKIKNVNRDNIPFSTTEQDVIKCWANKPLADLYTVEMYFSFDLDNKDMTLISWHAADENNILESDNSELSMGPLYHLYDNKHKASNTTDAGLSFNLKFNYPNIIYDENEIIENKIIFTDGSKVDLEMKCVGSPFLVSKFQSERQNKLSYQSPILADYIDPEDLDLKNYNYKALIIGINDYDRSIGSLDTALTDAIVLNDVLINNYNFETELLLNPTRAEIFDAMDYFSNTLNKNDNFIIYYAGHGELDLLDKNNSYWLPSDAQKKSKSNWISNLVITSWVKSLKSKHVLLIADSCYAGALSRGTIGNFNKDNALSYFQRLIDKKSRKLLASGGEEPVMDGGGGNHSVFAKALIDVLKENDVLMETYSLFDQIRKKVIVNSPQTPEYEIIFASGDDGGEFVFIPN